MAQKENSVSNPTLPTNIGKPAYRALDAAGFTRLEQFTKTTEADLLKLHGVGPKAIRLIRVSLNEIGLSFAEGE